MKKNLSIFKSIIVFTLLIMAPVISYGQNDLITNDKHLNMPPGMKLRPKFEFIDYSYKLDYLSQAVTSENTDKNFLQQFTEEELQNMKEMESEKYQYYIKAKDFYIELSPKVKSVFTNDELWHIYMFDENLTNKLRTIK